LNHTNSLCGAGQLAATDEHCLNLDNAWVLQRSQSLCFVHKQTAITRIEQIKVFQHTSVTVVLGLTK
jgi:hypothetical protein